MIDSSVMRDSNGADTSRKYDRGYDFEGSYN